MDSLCSHSGVIAGREQTVALFLAFNICSGIIWFFSFPAYSPNGKKKEITTRLYLLGGKKKKKDLQVLVNDCMW